MCKFKGNWDTQVSQEISHRWYELTNDISKRPSVQINRCVLTNVRQEDIKSGELHRFADASKTAYGGVVYLRMVKKGSAVTQLIASKSKLVLMKGDTIPRLELMASHKHQ